MEKGGHARSVDAPPLRRLAVVVDEADLAQLGRRVCGLLAGNGRHGSSARLRSAATDHGDGQRRNASWAWC